MNEYYMQLALALARKGKGKVNPNPMVGAVIVKGTQVIGQDYHQLYGQAHAEVNAISSATEDVAGSTLYVTLEPCSHYGKTPPCADLIIQKKFKKVVIGMLDPNPLVAGNGVRKLQEAGIEVVVGILEAECRELNEVFIKYILTKKPFVIMKAAMSLDGKIATTSGESKWITSEDSRKLVHEVRHEVSAIMVGVETVIKDNPELTCRLESGQNPIRIIADSTLRIPLDAKVITEIQQAPTIIATTKLSDPNKIAYLESLGIKVLILSQKDNKVDLQDLMYQLGSLNIDSILLEGGATLNFSALEQGIVDKVQIFIAPKFIGGIHSKTPVGGNGISALQDAYEIKNLTSRCIGCDILLEGYIEGGYD